ncbi:YozE family protein [Streptomyces sp. NPDC088748]|uniref:YozE family protein n=1 Tax=Streptomyces sp. NPDC088748 TaxID=3365887 RepID=UPI0038020AED
MSSEPNDFRSWLLTHVNDVGPISDLARDVRDDDEWPEPDGDEFLQLYVEHLEDCGANDDALEVLDYAWGLFQDRWHRQKRRRQARDLEDIRTYCGLDDLGVRLYLDDRARYCGREGTIIDTVGRYLLVLLDGDRHPTRCHPTANMEYETNAGWVKPPQRPPFAAHTRTAR